MPTVDFEKVFNLPRLEVDDLSGATNTGDGRVAPILDAGPLVRRLRHPLPGTTQS